ncbi:MAG TPA: OB-fold nucleic acid binding domain-containing protein, partial [Acidobacteriaceae bacterium]|nr:OB-fold nucleic acid binding domain-containing protein [Acidobacteriaceae bacterium]
GLMYVRGLKQTTAQALVHARDSKSSSSLSSPKETCVSCEAPHRFRDIDDLSRRVPQLNRRDLSQLARVGALNQLSAVQHRRDAIWQAEQAGRPAGPLLNTREAQPDPPPSGGLNQDATTNSHLVRSVKLAAEKPTFPASTAPTPLRQMSTDERLVADYAGTGLSVDHHPMAFRRAELRTAGVFSAKELHHVPNGRRVSTAGCVIARQRPGTALGFIFLSMEDETGIANVIIHPDLYDRDRLLITREKFLLVTGKLQNQDGVVHVKAEVVVPLRAADVAVRSHDFH